MKRREKYDDDDTYKKTKTVSKKIKKNEKNF